MCPECPGVKCRSSDPSQGVWACGSQRPDEWIGSELWDNSLILIKADVQRWSAHHQTQTLAPNAPSHPIAVQLDWTRRGRMTRSLWFNGEIGWFKDNGWGHSYHWYHTLHHHPRRKRRLCSASKHLTDEAASDAVCGFPVFRWLWALCLRWPRSYLCLHRTLLLKRNHFHWDKWCNNTLMYFKRQSKV